MKRNVNNNGFTLIELLISLVIIGIILGLALPQVSRLQSANREKKYDSYKQSLEAAAKVYVDNHSIDLFGNNENGCVTIPYSDLKRDNLIRDFGEKGIVCSNDDETFVDVTKLGNKYIYSSDLVCYDGSKVAYRNQDTKKEDTTVCSNHTSEVGDESEDDIPTDEEFDREPPVLDIQPPNTDNKWYSAEGIVNDLELKAIVSDDTGLNRNIRVQIVWDNLDNGETKTLKFNFNNKEVVRENVQLSKAFTKDMIPNDPEESGRYMVTISPDNTSGDRYGVQDNLGNYSILSAYRQEYWIDNQSPTMDPSVASTEESYHSKKVIVTINAHDTHAGPDKVYISNTGYEQDGSWQDYKDTYDWTLSGNYDGKERDIYITLMDKAGNKINKTIQYTVYDECSQTTEEITSTSDCSVSCGDGTATENISLSDKYTGASCGTTSKNVSCNAGACLPTNTCAIRGNTCLDSGFVNGWTCNTHKHNSQGYYQIYCTDSNGKLSQHDDIGGWVCGDSPYPNDYVDGYGNKWKVIDDSGWDKTYKGRVMTPNPSLCSG